MSLEHLESLVSVDWLQHALQSETESESLALLDASWFMPGSERSPSGEFGLKRIPGAAFFDIDRCCDHSTDMPHMLPSLEVFESTVNELGVRAGDHVVVYDSHGMFSAPRLWWMFRVFGHSRVSVLDGGLPAWCDAGGAIESGPWQAKQRPGAPFKATLCPGLVVSREQVIAAIQSGQSAIVDARSAGRFSGEQPEPRAGISSGHMPGALNVPFGELLDGGHFKSTADLRQIFLDAGLNEDAPAITSCGSGITACVLALGLKQLKREAAVYDGSWAEWAAKTDFALFPNK